MDYYWVSKTYVGTEAKSVREHVNKGIGYIVLQEQTTDKQITVAFKVPGTEEVPDGATPILSSEAIEKIEKISNARAGLHNE